MSTERQRNRDAVERLAARIKEHGEQKGGGMRSIAEAKQQAADVARRRDAEKSAGAGKSPGRGRVASERADRDAEARERAAGAKPGRVFIDHGRKKG